MYQNILNFSGTFLVELVQSNSWKNNVKAELRIKLIQVALKLVSISTFYQNNQKFVVDEMILTGKLGK